MKKIFLLLFIAMTFIGCGKKHKIQNLSGEDWYSANICFYENKKDYDNGGGLLRSEEIGRLKEGEVFSFSVKSNEHYLLMLAKDINGNSLGSDFKFILEDNIVSRRELIRW